MRTVLLGLALLAGLTILVGASSAPKQEPEDTPAPVRSFTITSDPSGPVVSMRTTAGLSFQRSDYALYGDGRFVRKTYDWAGEFLGSVETTLPFDELMQVVAIAVDYGLIDTDDAEIEGRMKALMRHDPRRARGSVADSGWIVVTIYLTSYTRDGNTTSNVEKRFKPDNPKILRRVFPEIAELGGQVEFLSRLFSIALRAEEQGAGNDS